MNYQIILDEQMLRSFINWLPDLQEGEAYYVSLLARSKYTDAIKSDKQQLKRFTSRKEDLYTKILQLECPYGAYTHKGAPVPQEALAIYITPNPRSLYNAMFGGLTTLAKCIQQQQRHVNPHQEVMSEIQRSKSRSCFVDFDFDHKSAGFAATLKEQIYACTGPSARVQLIETRGGFHVLIDPVSIDEAFRKSWFQRTAQLPYVDQTGDLLIPIPGCTQGGFIPVML
ncbi:hypothetical protein [Chitinophaga rhizophila]|uniref:Uncharacterized protein n=1 Tax=Chitinophaga rhizophila TaxID=2866212 RepID=A0ABS7GKP6_9BACT|nr:hypothetical protein [Chitinophaga rhizophila]MBW8688299.1 hypothetical protein [Chitinophaga rhizophila]